LPFFIFECNYAFLQRVPSVKPPGKDSFHDFTKLLSTHNLSPLVGLELYPRAAEGGAEEGYGYSKEMQMYVHALGNRYLWALASGVYRCLQKNYRLDPDDVEMVIDMVCDESPQEIDITSFIRILCAHYYHTHTKPILSAATDNMMVDVMKQAAGNLWSSVQELPPISPTASGGSNRGNNMIKDHTGSVFHGNTSTGSGASSAAGTESSQRATCGNEELQADVRRLFTEILLKQFARIPRCPSRLYFNGAMSSPVEKTASTRTSSQASGFTESFDDGDTYSNSDNMTEIADDEESIFETQLDTDDDDIHQKPMFLHLQCSVHYKSVVGSDPVRPVAVTTLPTCLRDILTRDTEKKIDLFSSNLSINLDVISLVQPAEPREGEDWKTADNLERHNSHESIYSDNSDVSDWIVYPILSDLWQSSLFLLVLEIY
jgi:predicted DNA-binding ribbon-helix-helix protein